MVDDEVGKVSGQNAGPAPKSETITNASVSGKRVLHFPTDRSLGWLTRQVPL